MGFTIDQIDDQPKQQTNDRTTDEEGLSQSQRTASKQNAEMYSYYQQMIKQLMTKYPMTSEKLALALILTRAEKATVSKNRDLTLLDMDKLISLQHKSLKPGDMRHQNMKLAVQLSGLKNNSFTRPRQPPAQQQAQSNRGNFQIFRLVRAAQMHYFQATRRLLRQSEEDVVNTSFHNDQ